MHEISQRRPFTSVLHVLVSFDVDCVTVVLVPPVPEFVELVTVFDVLEFTDELELTELREFTVFPAVVTDAACVSGVGDLPPGPHAASASVIASASAVS